MSIDRVFKIFVWLFGMFGLGTAGLNALAYAMDGKTGWAIAWGATALAWGLTLDWALRKISREIKS